MNQDIYHSILLQQLSMTDSKIPKRIFTAKPEVASLDPARTPSCYYHKQAITHFCVKKKCTLPLCQECLPVHKRQHINNKEIPNEGIVEFETARDDALTAFQERREEIQMAQQRFKGKVLDYKTRMIEQITGLLAKFIQDCLVTDGNLEVIAEIDERSNEIKRGSLKELIRYYEDIYGAEHFRKLYKMYTGEYLTNFKFEVDRKTLERITKDGIKNLNFHTQQVPATQITEKPEQLDIQSVPLSPVKAAKHTPQIPLKEPSPQKIKPENHRPLQNKVEKLNTQQVLNRKTTHQQDEQSQIHSYHLLKSKKRIEQVNIYTQHPSKLLQNPLHHPSHNTSNVSSKSKNKRKKGLSLAKSHKQLPQSQSSNFFTKTYEDQRTQNNNRKSNWRQFVNMKQTHPENQPGGDIIVTEPTTVLNPKQMRELLAKKKMEERQKELKVNKSAEFLVPPERINK